MDARSSFVRCRMDDRISTHTRPTTRTPATRSSRCLRSTRRPPTGEATVSSRTRRAPEATSISGPSPRRRVLGRRSPAPASTRPTAVCRPTGAGSRTCLMNPGRPTSTRRHGLEALGCGFHSPAARVRAGVATDARCSSAWHSDHARRSVGSVHIHDGAAVLDVPGVRDFDVAHRRDALIALLPAPASTTPGVGSHRRLAPPTPAER